MEINYDFFVAYSSVDRRAAQDLSWRLSDLKRRVFFDKSGLGEGVAWDSQLLEALEQSRVVAVLISPNTPSAHYEREEAVRAVAAMRSDPDRFVVPILLPGAQAVDVPYGLLVQQSIDGNLSGGMERVAATLNDKFPSNNSLEVQSRRNAYYALGAALRLDRVKQWGEILEASQLRENSLFLLHGPRDQNVGLFLERIHRFFSTELAQPRKIYRASFNIQGQRPRTGADWLAHIRDALQTSRPLAAEIRQLVQKQPIFILLGQNPLPLDKLERQYLDALAELITEKLPTQLREAGLGSGVAIMLALDYDREPAALITECEDWGRRAEEKGTLHFRPLPRVSLPSWDEVHDYLTLQIRPRPSREDVILIQQEYEQLASNPNIGFDKLARLIDAMTTYRVTRVPQPWKATSTKSLFRNSGTPCSAGMEIPISLTLVSSRRRTPHWLWADRCC